VWVPVTGWTLSQRENLLEPSADRNTIHRSSNL